MEGRGAVTEQLKACTKCNERKPLAAFHRDRGRPDGRVYRCKKCVRQHQIETGYTDKIREARIAYYYAHHEDSKRKSREQARLRNFRNYGITPERFGQMVAEQGGRCFLCSREAPLMVDHCHRTNTVRRLLCRQCNSGIGLLRDDPELLKRAIDYINGSWRDAGP